MPWGGWLAVFLGCVNSQWKGQSILRDFPMGWGLVGGTGLEQSWWKRETEVERETQGLGHPGIAAVPSGDLCTAR